MTRTLTQINPTTLPTIFPVANKFGDFASILNVVIPNLLLIALFILFIMLVYAGFQYITSGGNPENLKKVSETFKYMGIGIIVVLLSYFLVKLLGTIFLSSSPL